MASVTDLPPLTALAAAEARAKETGAELAKALPGFKFVLFIATPDGKYVTNTTNLAVQPLISMLLGQINNYVAGAVAPAGALAKGSTH